MYYVKDIADVVKYGYGYGLLCSAGGRVGAGADGSTVTAMLSHLRTARVNKFLSPIDSLEPSHL